MELKHTDVLSLLLGKVPVIDHILAPSTNFGLTFLINSSADVSVIRNPDNLTGEPMTFKLFITNLNPFQVYKIEHDATQFLDGKSFK